MVEYLVHLAVPTLRNLPELLHIVDVEVGNAPGFDEALGAQLLEAADRLLQRVVPPPVVEIEVEVLLPHTLEAAHE